MDRGCSGGRFAVDHRVAFGIGIIVTSGSLPWERSPQVMNSPRTDRAGTL